MMRGIVLISIISITCAFKTNAQVIDYEIDTAFNTGEFYSRGHINDLLIINNGNTLVTGNFTHPSTIAGGYSVVGLDGSVVFNQPLSSSGPGKVSTYLSKFLAYGVEIIQLFDLENGVDYSFRFEFQKQAYTGPLSNVALDAMVMPDDHILVAGRFFTDSTLMGTNESHLGLRQLCMIDSTGAPVEDFPMLRCEWPTNAQIYTIDRLSNGKYIIAGRFQEVEGHLTNSIARLNADFTVDTDFVSPLQEMVVAITRYIDSQDRIWLNFENGVLDEGSNEVVLNARLLPNGTVDESFSIPTLENHVESTIYNTAFAGVHEDFDGTYILTGSFTHFNDTLCNRIAKIYDNGHLVVGAFGNLGADEAVWGTWTTSFGPSIGTILPLPNGKLLLGGRFSSFGGEPYSCLVRLEPNGFVGVDDQKGRGKLKIWPNPSGGTFKVSLPDANERIEQVEIYDLQGRTIAHTSHLEEGQARIEIHNLAAGIYLVKAGSSKGVYTQKLVVE